MIDLNRASSRPRFVPGKRVYEEPLARTFRYVPSLSFLCILLLSKFPLHVHHIGPLRLNYRPPSDPQAFDILRALCPPHSDVDPRLWATLVQIYDNLPAEFSSYAIPLGDEYLPNLQAIQCTPQFSLVTILELPNCSMLTDDSIAQLKLLHTLTALDITGAKISPAAIKTLSATLLWTDPEPDIPQHRRGPWSLRMLCLKDCSQLSNAVLPHLLAFPMLSIVDLRGTKCRIDSTYPFRPCRDKTLFHPTPIADALRALSARFTALYSSPNPYSLHVKTLYHNSPPLTSSSSTIPPDAFFVLPPSGHILQGDSRRLQLEQEVLDHPKTVSNTNGVKIRTSAWVGTSQSGVCATESRVRTIVAAEADLLQARRAMLSFYSEPILTPKATLSSAASEKNEHDSTLYRDPPSWRDLPDQPPKRVERTLYRPQVAKINHKKAKEWKRANEHRAAPLPLSDQDRVSPIANSPLSNSVSSRNPFKRRASTGTKALKPITSIEIPPLPQEVRIQAAKEREVSPKTRSTMLGSSNSRRSSLPPSRFDWKAWAGKS